MSHIGNIKLGPINLFHRTSEISYFIGEKHLWGKGYASMAIKKIIKLARIKKIRKLKAGFYAMNRASKKVLKRNGFKIEGVFRSDVKYNNKRYSAHWYGKIV